MESHVLSRIFEFNGVRLPEVSPKLSPEEIRTLYSQQYPDIATATITGAGGSGRQAGLSLHASDRHKGMAHEPTSQKQGGDEAGGPGGT